ncbi:14804_t:CDS:1 [Dentiscutata erythropus]|uniref:14804_t:CDS:1 n=1 Tax=Dentiscutata erythropus TaxID=1348616 RepID=A0A9N8VAJ8_9GLOM|nr:14804_t:CDS:1 [Dentiscutata erythropus]
MNAIKNLSSRRNKRSSDPAQALYAEGEQLTEWLLVKYNAIAVLENSNKHDKYIQYLKTIPLKNQSIQTKQIQLSEDEVQGLRNAKNDIENYITENIQKNIKILENEIVNLNGYSQNGIKTKDDLIYQQEVRYLNTLSAENEKLKNYLREKRDQYVKLNIIIDDKLIQKQNININDSEFDANGTIEKLESSYKNLNNEKINLISNICKQLNKNGNFSNEELHSLKTEKNKLKDFITNQCAKFETSISKETLNATNTSSNGWQLIKDIQIFCEEKVRIENHLKEKLKEQIELNPPTLNEFMQKYAVFNDETKKIENELTRIKDENKSIIDRKRRLQNQIKELNKESEEVSSINNTNGARYQLIQTLLENVNDLYNQKRDLRNYLMKKYDLLIQLVNLNDEHPVIEKYEDYRNDFKCLICEKFFSLRKTNNNEVIISCGGERIDDTCHFQTLYNYKRNLKTYLNTQLKKTIDDFNSEKRKLEEKLTYINATKKYQNLKTNIKSLHKKICEWKSDLVNRYNQLIKLKKFINDDSSEYTKKVNKLMEEIQPFEDVFTNQQNIENLIDDCEQTINKYGKENLKLQAERDFIATAIDSVKVRIESDLINRYRQLIELGEFKKWTLVSDEYHYNIKKIDTNNIPNPNDTNDVQNNTDRIRQLETNVSNLEGDMKSKDEKMCELKGELEARDIQIHELLELNSSLRNEAAKYSLELGKATNFEFGDHDSNNIGQLSSEIKKLRHDLEFFCTLRNASITESYMKNLLKKYNCSAEILGKKYNKNLLEGLLQRYIIEITISKAKEYLNIDEWNKEACLEAKIKSVTNRLQEYTIALSTQRFGTDKVSPAIPTKLRQMVYTLLSNRGFSKNKDEREHPVIERLTKEILNIMNSCRKINDPVKNKEIESMTTKIVRQIIVIFLFRFKVQEPIIEYLWFESRDKIEPEFMEYSVNDELKNAEVGICSFPLIVTNFRKQNHKVISKANIVRKSF